MSDNRDNNGLDNSEMIRKEKEEKEKKEKTRVWALLRAARKGDAKIVELFLSRGVDIEARDEDGLTPLMLAARNKCIETAELLIKKGAEIDAKNERGSTSLMCAAEVPGNEAVVELLLSHGADATMKNDGGCTALMYAAYVPGNEAVVELLLSHGADANMKDNRGYTALYFATNKGCEASAEVMQKYKEEKEEKEDPMLALNIAARRGDLAKVELLVSSNADVNYIDKDGFTPLMLAAMYKCIETAELLIKKGAEINAKNKGGCTALMYAAYVPGNEAMVELLLSHGADVYIKGDSGFTALAYAANKGCKASAEVLQKYKDEKEEKEDPMLALNIAARRGDLAKVELLVNSNADVNYSDKDGFTPLMLAAMYKCIETAELLIKKEGEIDAKNDQYNGCTALMCAAEVPGNEAMVELLLSHGADASMKNNNEHTALYIASSIYCASNLAVLLRGGAVLNEKSDYVCMRLLTVCAEDTDVFVLVKERLLKDDHLLNIFMLYSTRFLYTNRFDILVRMGISINHEDEDKDTPLTLACANSSSTLALSLIQRGADVNQINSFGQTAYDYAIANGLDDVVTALVKKGVKPKQGRDDFPREGLSLSDIRSFIADVGEDNLVGKTTEDVCEMVKDVTVNTSYTQHLSANKGRELKPANVFVSHAWSYLFLDVVKSLERTLATDDSAIVWFDIFCINEHAAVSEEKPFGWWSTTFKNAIKNIGRVVVVLTPWHDPKPFHRAWCIFEIYSAISTLSRLELTVTEEDREAIHSGHIDLEAFVNGIDVSKAEAFKKTDLDSIIRTIEKYSGGVDDLNKTVRYYVKESYDSM